MCRSAQQLAHRPACLSRLSRPPACRPARLPRLDSAWPCSARCSSTWLDLARVGFGTLPRLRPPGSARPGPGQGPARARTGSQSGGFAYTEQQSRSYGGEQIQKVRSRTKINNSLVTRRDSAWPLLSPARPGPARLARPRLGLARPRSAQLNSAPLRSARLSSPRPSSAWTRRPPTL